MDVRHGGGVGEGARAMRGLIGLVLSAALVAGCGATSPTPRPPGIGEVVRTADGWDVTVADVFDVEARPDNPYDHKAGQHYWVASLVLGNHTGYKYLTGDGIRMVGTDGETHNGAVVGQYRGSLNHELTDGQTGSGNVTFLLPDGTRPAAILAKPGTDEVRIEAGVLAPTPTPRPSASPSAPPSPAAAASPSPKPTATAKPTPSPKVAILVPVPCPPSTKDCQSAFVRLTETTPLGGTTRFALTIRNAGAKTSGPVSAIFMLNMQQRQWLPDYFDFTGCRPACKFQMAYDDTGWYVEWPGRVPPRKSVTFTVTMRPKAHGGTYYLFHELSADLYAAPLSLFDKDPNAYFAKKIATFENLELWVE